MSEQEKEMSNDEILKRITAHQEAIKKLKKDLKPATALPTATLAETNADLLSQRKAAFAKKKEKEDAIKAALVIAEQQKKTGSRK